MATTTNIIKILFVVLLLGVFIPQNIPLTRADAPLQYDGDKVFIDDEYVYLSAQPHTIGSSQWVYFDLISKVFSGNIDLAFGFNLDYCKPTKAEVWLNYTHPRYKLIDLHPYSYQDENGTWHNGTNPEYGWVDEKYEDWAPWNMPVTPINHNYQGFDKWYVSTNLLIAKNVNYKCRIYLEMPFAGLSTLTGKYYFAIKPSAETIGEAINNGHFYYLDPWWNSQWQRMTTIAFNSSRIVENQTDIPILIQIPPNISVYCDSGNSLRFYSDNSTALAHEIDTWSTTGYSYVWIRTTEVTTGNAYGANTTVSMYYNNSIATNPYASEDVWNGGEIPFTQVLHMNYLGSYYDFGPWTTPDSSSLNKLITRTFYTGGAMPLNATGVVGNAWDFTPARQDYLTANGSDTNNATMGNTSLTMIWWYSMDAKDANDYWYASAYSVDVSGKVYVRQNQVQIRVKVGGNQYSTALYETNDTGTHWSQCAFVADFTGQRTKTYANGSLIVNKSTTYDNTYIQAGTSYPYEPRYCTDYSMANPDYYVNGRIDEWWIINGSVTDGFINVSYRNIQDPLNFSLILYNSTYPVVNLALPVNSSSSQDILPMCSAYLNVSTIVCNMTFQWYNTTISTWETFGTNYSVGTGRYYQRFWNATAKNTNYQWRVTAVNVSEGVTDTKYGTFTTLNPTAPTNVVVSKVNNTALNITWTNYTRPSACAGNVTCLVKYSTSSYPSSVGAGYTLYNGSAVNYTTLSNCTEETTYYFSLWTYYEHLGVYALSSYTTTTGATSGGNYTFTILWECNQTAVTEADLLASSTLTITHVDGKVILYDDAIAYYRIYENISYAADIVYFTFDNITRAVTPWTGQYNVTIYVCCEPECLYCEPNNYSSFQFPYTFSFYDLTPNMTFLTEPSTRFYIYLYNSTGIKYYVHQDYLSASDTVTASLEYGKTFYCGIQNNYTNYSYIGSIQPLSTYTIQITIPGEGTTYYSIGDLINISLSNDSAGIWVNYTDSVFGTTSVTLKFYNYSAVNHLNVNNYSFTGSEEDYHWLVADGADLSATYSIVAEIQHQYFTENQTMSVAFISSYISPLYSVDWINGMLNGVLGTCPLYPVSWTQTIAFAVFMLCLLSFGMLYQEIGVIASSVILIFIEAVVLDDSLIRGLVIGFAVFAIMFAMIIYIRRVKNEPS